MQSDPAIVSDAGWVRVGGHGCMDLACDAASMHSHAKQAAASMRSYNFADGGMAHTWTVAVCTAFCFWGQLRLWGVGGVGRGWTKRWPALSAGAFFLHVMMLLHAARCTVTTCVTTVDFCCVGMPCWYAIFDFWSRLQRSSLGFSGRAEGGAQCAACWGPHKETKPYTETEPASFWRHTMLSVSSSACLAITTHPACGRQFGQGLSSVGKLGNCTIMILCSHSGASHLKTLFPPSL